MNAEHQTSATADPAHPEPSTARAERCTCCGGGREPDPTDVYMRMLRRLAEIGMARAEQIFVQTQDAANARPDEAAPPKVDPPKPKLPDPDLALHRTARLVRLSMVLSLKFHNERLEREKQAAAEDEAVEKKRKARRKQQIERGVKQAIDREAAERDERPEAADADDGFNPYELHAELSERLDEDDIERDLDRCPRGELIGRICREFGIEPDWDFLRQQEWAIEEARLDPPAPEPDAAEPEAAIIPPEPEPEAAAPPEIEVQEPEPPAPEPDNPYEAQMKARLVMALRSGAWLMALQMDPRLASYLHTRLINSS